MKFDLVLIFGLVTLVALCSARPAEEDYAEYDEAEPAPPPKKAAPARPVAAGRRNPLAARPNNKAGASTTTTAAPKEEEEVEEADYEEEAQPQEASSSTTEAPKKFLKGGIVRPFRSNDDLLATLKRRREQVVSNKHSKPVQQAEGDESDPAPVEAAKSRPSASSTSGRRNRFNGKEKNGETPAATTSEDGSTAAPARTGGRRFHNRS